MSGEPDLRPATVADLDAIEAVERQAYEFPWTRGNFIDSMAAGHGVWLLSEGPTPSAPLLGYLVAMPGVEEMHLLNITVRPDRWGQGHARRLLAHLVQQCRLAGAHQLWLEVRDSNARARALYARQGFAELGRRKAYYPAAGGRREDAIVMCLPVEPAPAQGGEGAHALV